MKKDRIFPVRISDEDYEILEALWVKMRVTAKADVLREGLYLLAAKHKVTLKSAKK
jgi:hypothetical protein